MATRIVHVAETIQSAPSESLVGDLAETKPGSKMSAICRSMHRAMQTLYARCVFSTSAGSTNERLDKVNALFAEARLLLQEYVSMQSPP